VARPCNAAYSNRAACHTELDAFSAAIEDAETCIALEPAWVKGYSRKGRVELLTKEYGTARPGHHQPGFERRCSVAVTCIYCVYIAVQGN
jgi:hypothetical protein